MLFKYTHADESGSKRTGEIAAASRNEAMSKLRSLGIAPIKLQELTKAPKKSAPVISASVRNLCIAVLTAITIAVALMCTNLFRDNVEPTAQVGAMKATAHLKRVKPSPSDQHQDVQHEEPAIPRPVPAEKPSDWDYMSKRERSEWMRENRPIDTNTVISTAPVVSSFRKKKSGKRPNFNNYVQSELAHYVIPGTILPPPDYITDEQAREAFDVPIEYLIDDSAATLEEKQTVSEMLQELREFMDAGGHANEYFQQLYARQEAEGEAIQTARHEVRLLLEEGRIDDARETLEAFNAYLAEKGIPPINVKVPSRFIQ